MPADTMFNTEQKRALAVLKEQHKDDSFKIVTNGDIMAVISWSNDKLVGFIENKTGKIVEKDEHLYKSMFLPNKLG